VILDPSKRWQCPSCDAQHVTKEPRPHTPMHPCRGQGGLTVPYVEVIGTELGKRTHRHVQVEREDYMNGDDAGRVMAVRTERPDGSYDCTVYPPTATVIVQ
jgi:hypothetical protein